MTLDNNKPRKTLQDYDMSDRPEEKLMLYGAQHLSDSELLALFLRTGTVGRTVIELAEDIIDTMSTAAPGRRGLSSLMMGSYNDFLSIKGIGKSKAARLMGMVEIARRMREPFVTTVALTSPKLVYEFMRPQMFGLQQEEFHVLGLNTKKQLHYVERISKGTVDKTVVHPRDVFQGAISKKCHSIILIHNHPTGSSDPSEADKMLTKRLCQAGDILGITVNDHIIIGDHQYYSFLEDGAI